MHSSAEMTPAAGSQPSLIRHRSFVLFWCARTSTTGAYQMLAVAVGWQLYDLTNDALDLGILGLIRFTQIAKALAALLLAVGTAGGWLTRELMFTILFVVGIARAFEMPTLHAI